MTVNCPLNLTPLDQSSNSSAPKLGSISYTNQDFWSMKTRLLQFISEKFSDDFNDFTESSNAIMLIENFAFLADTLSFKMDQIFNEIFISTATQIENVSRTAEFVGFKPTPPIAATALFTASIGNPLSVDLTIPGGLSMPIFSGGNTINYELFPADSDNNPIFNSDIVIPAGNVVNSSIVGIEGKTVIDNFTATGLPNQNVQLNQFPVIFDSITVNVDGTQWTEVDFFTDSNPRREYRVEFTSDYEAFAIFGNNRTGLIPPLGSNIQVTYRVGGGTIGNIVTSSVNFNQLFLVEALGFSTSVNFTNYTKGQNGYNGDTIEDIRNNLPRYLATQNRAVSGADYESLTDLFSTPYNGKIGKSTVVLRNYGCAGNVIDIYVLALSGTKDLTPASDQLKTALFQELDTKKMITDYICIRDGVVLLVEIMLDLTVDKSLKKLKDEIDSKVNTRIDNFFALSNWSYGQTLKDKDLIKALTDITELSNIEVSLITNDPDNSGSIVTAKFYEIIRPDVITINYLFE